MSDNAIATPTGRKRRNFTEEEKAVALETLNLNGGNLERTAEALGLVRETLRQWSIGHCVSEEVFADFAQKKAGRMTAKLRALADRLADSLASEEKIESARYGELNAAFGTIFDKLRLIDAQPTAITENRTDTEQKEKALALLEQYLQALNGDRAQAIALLREDAPTLGRFVN